jgi:hypothetical protein
MTQRTLVRIFLLGLPIGTVVFSACSLWLHFRSEAQKKKNVSGSSMKKEISSKDLEFYVKRLAADIGPRHLGQAGSLRRAAAFIEGMLGPNNIGYQTVNRQTWTEGGEEVANVSVDVPGEKRGAGVLVVGAHYDTVAGTPGANDNATGVAALLSLAQAFLGTSHQRTIRFQAFANEEPPYFWSERMGSFVSARLSKEQGEGIAGMICLETLGYYSDAAGSQQYPPGAPAFGPDTANFVAFVGYESAGPFIQQSAEAFRAGSAFPLQTAALPESVPQAGWSDHWSFWKCGYPAFMVTDTALFRYSHYHAPTDTPDKIRFDSFTRVVEGLKAMIEKLANPIR